METCFEILMAPDQTFLLLLRQLCDHAMRIAFAILVQWWYSICYVGTLVQYLTIAHCICCFGTVVHSDTVVVHPTIAHCVPKPAFTMMIKLMNPLVVREVCQCKNVSIFG